MGLHFIDKTFHRQRRFFIDKGKYKDEKKREKKNISCKKYLPGLWKIFSVYEMSNLWNVLSMNCPVYELSYLWNVLSMKCPEYEMSYLRNVIAMKCPVCEMSYLWNVLSMKCLIYEMSCLWNVLSMKCPIYEMSYLWNVQSMKWPQTVISSEPEYCQDRNVWFTTVPFDPLFDE